MSSPKKVIGIDPSATATGVIVLQENGTDKPDLIYAHEIKPKNMTGITRARFICQGVMEMIVEHKPDTIVIEGYSLNMRNASSVVPLVELGGLLRFCLQLDGLSWYDPRASELKQFATGKGTSQKDVVMMNVFKRWGYEAPTNNLADAYVLAAMGLAVNNRIKGLNQQMLKIAGNMSKRDN